MFHAHWWVGVFLIVEWNLILKSLLWLKVLLRGEKISRFSSCCTWKVRWVCKCMWGAPARARDRTESIHHLLFVLVKWLHLKLKKNSPETTQNNSEIYIYICIFLIGIYNSCIPDCFLRGEENKKPQKPERFTRYWIKLGTFGQNMKQFHVTHVPLHPPFVCQGRGNILAREA